MYLCKQKNKSVMIPFNKPYCSGREQSYIQEVCQSTTMSGNGQFTKLCHGFFEKRYGFRKCLLTTSGTDALEMCAMLCELKPGDEVIVPSYTFVSSAIAFLREGAFIRFADSGKDNPNITVEAIEPLINEKTRVIVVVHYAGVACDMDAIMALAEKHHLLVVEDAAHSIDSFYHERTSALSVVRRLYGRRVPTVPSSIVVWSTSMVGATLVHPSFLLSLMQPSSGHS